MSLQPLPVRKPSPQPFAKAMKGFEGIKRYWDHTNNAVVAKILPGEFYVTGQAELISTVLGSCISACIRDKRTGLGGMNHFMLPTGPANSTASEADLATRYGLFAMEHLINELLSNGGRRGDLEIKLFGGGKMFASMNDVGQRNIHFARQFLVDEGYKLMGEDVGGPYPRKVMYAPKTGKVRIKKLANLHNDTIEKRENRYMHSIEDKPVAGEIDLF